MNADADAVVIGAGLSGLVDSILLAETGRRVVVLEQHDVPGGYLQQFQRKKTTFDVGFHYLGSTLPGLPLRQMFQHLGVWPWLEMLPFPEEAAIEVHLPGGRFAFPPRLSRFREAAYARWPHAREALDRFLHDVEETCARFRWFDLHLGRDYEDALDLKSSPLSLRDYVAALTDDPWLKEVLSSQSFHLGLYAHEIPWTKFALAFRSNFDLTSRVDGGGGAIVAALLRRARELNVIVRLSTAAAAFDCEGHEVRAVVTSGGDRIAAPLFVAACHPKPVLRLLPDEALRPVYKERILAMKESRGALQLFLRLKAPLRSLGATCLLLQDPTEELGEFPIPPLLVTYALAVESAPRGGPRLEAMTYVAQAPFARWRALPVLRRGAEYDALKRDLARRMIGIIAREVPELPDLVEDAYVATPLSDEWYTKNEEGSVFGISHDLAQQGSNRPLPRTRVKNLFFTGHSITMPGICGVVINAFDTMDRVRGDQRLFRAVAT